MCYGGSAFPACLETWDIAENWVVTLEMILVVEHRVHITNCVNFHYYQSEDEAESRMQGRDILRLRLELACLITKLATAAGPKMFLSLSLVSFCKSCGFLGRYLWENIKYFRPTFADMMRGPFWLQTLLPFHEFH